MTTPGRPLCAQVTSVHRARDVRIFRKIARSLAAAGYDVVVIHPEGILPDEGAVRFSGVELNGSRMRRLMLGGWRVFRRARALGATVFHFHDPELLPWGILWRLTGGVAIYDVHEDVPRGVVLKPWIPRLLRRPLAVAVGVMETLAGRICNAIVTATEPIAAHFPAARTIVVRNYPEDLASFRARAKPWSERSNTIVYAGTLTPDRGFQLMIDAAVELDPSLGAQLVLAGPLRGQAVVDSRGVVPDADRVRFEGEISRECVVELVGSARVGLHVVRPLEHFKESLPIKIFEYMALGTPMIVSDFPAWRDIVLRHGCGLVVDPESAEDLATACAELLLDPKRAEAMGRRGLDAVGRYYDWSGEAARLRDLYKRLLPP